MNQSSQIQYLNTDLDVISESDLSSVAAEFEAGGIRILHSTKRNDGLFSLCCEDDNATEPEPNIARMLDVIEGFSATAQELWKKCTLKEFNIGYDCGDEPWEFNQGLSSAVINRLAACGASIRITLYPERSQENSHL